MPTKQAKEIAAKCGEAYSANRYNSWPQVAQACLDMGYSALEAEAIMRSKYTRWAADGSDKPYGKTPASALADMRANYPAMFSAETIAELVRETFCD